MVHTGELESSPRVRCRENAICRPSGDRTASLEGPSKRSSDSCDLLAVLTDDVGRGVATVGAHSTRAARRVTSPYEPPRLRTLDPCFRVPPGGRTAAPANDPAIALCARLPLHPSGAVSGGQRFHCHQPPESAPTRCSAQHHAPKPRGPRPSRRYPSSGGACGLRGLRERFAADPRVAGLGKAVSACFGSRPGASNSVRPVAAVS